MRVTVYYVCDLIAFFESTYKLMMLCIHKFIYIRTYIRTYIQASISFLTYLHALLSVLDIRYHCHSFVFRSMQTVHWSWRKPNYTMNSNVSCQICICEIFGKNVIGAVTILLIRKLKFFYCKQIVWEKSFFILYFINMLILTCTYMNAVHTIITLVITWRVTPFTFYKSVLELLFV